MRYQGRVSEWRDDKGFGFVTPNGGGERAFVHINAFSSRSVRPVDGDLISYEVGLDDHRRPQARRIRFAGDVSPGSNGSAMKPASKAFSIGLAVGSLLAVFALYLGGLVPVHIPFAYLGMSLITMVMYAVDKSSASRRGQRTPENTLHLAALLGGWPGALVAQQMLRHKTVKPEFRVIFWVSVIGNCAALGWLILSDSGADFLRALPVL